VVVSSLLAACKGQIYSNGIINGVSAYAAPLTVSSYQAAAPAVPSVTSSQYRSGDEYGNNAFGYSNINSARQEQGNDAGVTGSYSYVDEAGSHTVSYIADALGYRVTGHSNLPIAAAGYGRHRRSIGYGASPYALNYGVPAYPAPLTVSTYQAAAPAVPSVTSTQFRSGDEYGNNAFGYSNINSARQEQGNDAGVTGSYSYVDEAGSHTVSYIADALGYRVTGATNLPVPARGYLHKRSVGDYAVPLATYAGAEAPAREAVLTTIQLNPGHATFYRVD